MAYCCNKGFGWMKCGRTNRVAMPRQCRHTVRCCAREIHVPQFGSAVVAAGDNEGFGRMKGGRKNSVAVPRQCRHTVRRSARGIHAP